MANTNNAVPATPVAQKIVALKDYITKPAVQDQLKAALQENIEPFTASIIDLYSGDSYLQECQPEQVVMQALKAAVLKLPVIKSLGFAYVVPYKKNGKAIPQLQIGYKGLIQLALRTGQYRIINADAVLEGEYRSRNKLTGEFDLNGEATSSKVIGYFAHFEMTNGFSKTLYMTREKVEAHGKKYSKSFNNENSIWKTEFDAMALKTVIRGLLSHWGYLSVEMQHALTEEDKDAAEEALQEIQQKGNKKPMQFDKVEEAHTDEPAEFTNEETAPFA